MAQSALIVRVPEAESLVSSLRARFDPSAQVGIPAHITVLYPFVQPEKLSPEVLEAVHSALQSEVATTFQLGKVGRFSTTAYLSPEPAEYFVGLTRRLISAFPDHLPYGGEHKGVVPHLTVAHGGEEEAAHAEAELLTLLAKNGPIRSTCSAVVLLENSSGVWREAHAFPLPQSAVSG